MKCSVSRLGPRRFAPLPRTLAGPSPVADGHPRTIPFLISREEQLHRLGPIAESLGYRFHALGSVEELAKYLREFPSAAVWTDSCLPDGDWRDVLALCQQQSPSPPLIVTSLSDSPALWAEAAEAGVAEFLAAPFAAPEVRRCLLSPSTATPMAEPVEAAL